MEGTGDETRFGAAVGGARVVVTVGPGGVGKTTVAAALGVEAARRGSRVVVVTVDPARRLADALGLGRADLASAANTPRPVPGPWPGVLSAVMLDTKATFDTLVRRHAATPAQADLILANPFYRNISGSLSGTQEYMATEKLYDLATAGDVDLVVVDTPPSRHALDFLDAPGRLTRFLDHRLYRMLTAPGRTALRVANLATRPFLWTVRKVAGSEVVDDAIAFFQAFEGMDEGFRQRAAAVDRLLRDDATVFVVCTSPRAEAVGEARHLAEALLGRGFGVGGVVVNLVHRRPPGVDAVDAPAGSALADLMANHDALASVADEERNLTGPLRAVTGGAPMVALPLLDGDVHDIATLTTLAGALTGRPVEPAADGG